jgi:tRNA (guanine-N7-)-methyltransferase
LGKSKGKLIKFAENARLPNVLQNHEGHDNIYLTDSKGEKIAVRGNWKAWFGNSNPITLELACGFGEYAVELARRYPTRNFVGIDIKGARIWNGAKIALRENLPNVAFVRARIEEILCFFDTDEVDEIWITFPDPFLRKSRANHRLTSMRFLGLYRQIVKEGNPIHLKTDEPNLYAYTLETVAEAKGRIEYCDNDIYSKPLPLPELGIKTNFEQLDIAQESTVKYVRFTLPEEGLLI